MLSHECVTRVTYMIKGVTYVTVRFLTFTVTLVILITNNFCSFRFQKSKVNIIAVLYIRTYKYIVTELNTFTSECTVEPTELLYIAVQSSLKLK